MENVLERGCIYTLMFVGNNENVGLGILGRVVERVKGRKVEEPKLVPALQVLKAGTFLFWRSF